MNIKELANMIVEQGQPVETGKPAETFSINVAISNLKGGEDVQWTTRYERTCRRLTDDYDRKICKYESQWSAINLLISKMIGLRSQCRKSSNPEGCGKSLQNAMMAERMKQRKIRAQIQQIRREKNEANRRRPPTPRPEPAQGER